jgi:hypothetical protein
MNENCVVGHSDIVVRSFLSVIKDIITDREEQEKAKILLLSPTPC